MRIYWIIGVLLLTQVSCWAQQTAIIEDSNKKVILYEDGTWKYADAATVQPGALPEVYQTIVRGMKEGKVELFKNNCTAGYWNAKSDGGERMYRQAVRKKFDFEISSKAENGDRVVYHVDVIVGGRKVDLVFMFFARQEGKWLLDGISENKFHRQLFLQGKISGHFYPLSLSGTPEFEKIAMTIVDAVTNAETKQTFLAQLTPDSGVAFAQVEKLPELAYKSNHVWANMYRAVIIFEYADNAGGKGATRQKAALYFKMVADKWQLYAVSTWGYVSLEQFLAD